MITNIGKLITKIFLQTLAVDFNFMFLCQGPVGILTEHNFGWDWLILMVCRKSLCHLRKIMIAWQVTINFVFCTMLTLRATFLCKRSKMLGWPSGKQLCYVILKMIAFEI